jgi:hypothetical protein
MRSTTWKIYLKNIRAILRSIDQCAKDVKEIQTAMLVRVCIFNIPTLGDKINLADYYRGGTSAQADRGN